MTGRCETSRSERPTPVGITRNYTTFSQAVDEVVDARVWSGIHFRHADEVGAAIGQRVARWQECLLPQASDHNDQNGDNHRNDHDR